ncbi:hypothetical protein HanXRQr2_Chr17g0791451 [Helianthus annuus]|uniref:Uncharacterized protein n=1 Tax=Helianthus annuus TaxID=4232 RepID=A0A9K3DFB7_HELAN|nr:hypothetical protein HanXRQr2_Chr17g0791451 [Helianthus annuus]
MSHQFYLIWLARSSMYVSFVKGKWTVSPSTKQNWPIPRPIFKLAPTTPNWTVGLLCHPVVN